MTAFKYASTLMHLSECNFELNKTFTVNQFYEQQRINGFRMLKRCLYFLKTQDLLLRIRDTVVLKDEKKVGMQCCKSLSVHYVKNVKIIKIAFLKNLAIKNKICREVSRRNPKHSQVSIWLKSKRDLFKNYWYIPPLVICNFILNLYFVMKLVLKNWFQLQKKKERNTW